MMGPPGNSNKDNVSLFFEPRISRAPGGNHTMLDHIEPIFFVNRGGPSNQPHI